MHNNQQLVNLLAAGSVPLPPLHMVCLCVSSCSKWLLLCIALFAVMCVIQGVVGRS